MSDFLPWSFDHIIQSAGFESLGYPWDKLAQIFKLQNLAIPVLKPVEKVGYLELSICIRQTAQIAEACEQTLSFGNPTVDFKDFCQFRKTSCLPFRKLQGFCSRGQEFLS